MNVDERGASEIILAFPQGVDQNSTRSLKAKNVRGRRPHAPLPPPCGARAACANGRGRRSAPPREPQQTAREGGRCCVAHASSRGRATWGVLNMLRCSASGERGGCSGCTAIPAGCSECRACPTPHPKCCPISRSEIDSLHPVRPTAAERATVVRPSPGRRSFLFCDRWLADYSSRSSP